ncbi:mitochondrial transcription rescue factor 1 [Pristis pectinata]|uniref:mitochondrial transcription rescue factor 1 n=1 Tax=Pristis pectinata TaxID=685728 RepID=UPI00223DB020|nr:mitochondrial transcription rescue factor 1 [Pristis pectinata]XP_051881184.1 mitochondrial transcription rescue factor 1 [Pristis pectinata]
MSSLIFPARTLKSLSTYVIFWRKCASRELCGAQGVQAICTNFTLNLNTVEQRFKRHHVLPGLWAKPLIVFMRLKSSKKRNKKMLQQNLEEDEESDDPEKSDYEDESEEEEDDCNQPKIYKDLEKVVVSFRFDLIMKAGLDIARNKVEDAFYGNKLRLNGERLLKKSKVVKEGDVLDHLIGEDKEAETVTVMRVVLRKVAEEMTDTDKYRVTLRRWKNLKLPRAEVFK